ncbi:lipoprotein [Mycoplasma feriruminatoris]|uniref:MAG6090-like repeat-containing lipoprotein n=1 Tax=Mycoplasma feriruminatoris TaxID=1179777 RepID=UPI00241F755B|nr:lipoprotein [Mycoplasma feriruminatoris]WFQ96336.1 lipoprotein [Mycoplasma feriruminatoris]
MKKLLTILGALTISASGAALVIACNKPAKPDNKVEPTNPTNPGDANPGEPKNPGEANPGVPKKPGEPGEANPGVPKKPGEPGDANPGEPKKPGETTPPADDKKPPITPPSDNKPTKPEDTIRNAHFKFGDPSSFVGTIHNSKFESGLSSAFAGTIHNSKFEINNYNSDIVAEEKRLEEWVKEYLDKVDKMNEKALDDFVSRLPKDVVDRENERLEEWANEYIARNKRENEKLVKYVLDNKINEIFMDSPTGLDIYPHKNKDSIKRAEEILDVWANTFLERVKRYNEKFIKNYIKDQWENRAFNFSPTGSDIYPHITKEQIDEILKKNKEFNLAFHRQNIDILKNEIVVLKSNKFVIENEFNKKEKELKTLAEKTITEAKNKLEVLSTTLKETELGINKIKEDLLKTNVENEFNKSKETLEELEDLLDGAKELAKEYGAKEEEYNKQLARAKDLDARINSLNSYIDLRKGLMEANSNIERQIQETQANYDQLIAGKTKELKEIEAKDKELTSIINDANSTTNSSYDFYYNFGGEETYAHKIIEKTRAELNKTKEQEKQLKKLEQDLKNNKKKLLDELVIRKIGARQADSAINAAMKKLEEVTKQKQEADTNLSKINDEVVKTKEYVKLYNGNVEKLETEIQDVIKAQSNLSKKLNDSNEQLTQLQAKKLQTEKMLKTLTQTSEKTISETMANYDKQVLELEKQVFAKEEPIEKEIAELEKTISKIQQFIQELDQHY